MESFTQYYNNINDYCYNSTESKEIAVNLNFIENKLIEKSKKNSIIGAELNKDPKNKKYNSLFSVPGIGNEKLGSKTSLRIDPNLQDGKNFWIVKASDLNRGRCIKLADSLGKIQKLVKKFNEGIYRDFSTENYDEMEYTNILKGKKNLSEEEKKKVIDKKYRSNFVIIQKYLEKPLLYRGRKFDIRIWVLVTHKLKVYIFKEGHLKTSSVAYDINAKDSYVHITNYSVQKNNDNFSKYEYGNEVSFKDFQIFLDECHSEKKYNVQNNFVSKMKEIIELSIRAVKDKLNSNERSFSFEIYGYDFIMDSDFNIFLLEINTNPGLEESSPLIKVLVPRMIDDALRLTIDEVCDTKYSFSACEVENVNILKEEEKSIYISPFPVEDYSDSENLWEIVCDFENKIEKVEKVEKNDKVEKKEKQSRRSKLKN